LNWHFRKAIKEGVVVCAFVQKPSLWKIEHEKNEVVEFQRNCKEITDLKIHLNLREDTHHKIAAIDRMILYEGSLNLLSANKNGDNMRRFHDAATTEEGIHKWELDTCDPCTQAIEQQSVNPASRRVISEMGGKLFTLREKSGLSQRELAIACGLSHQTISALEAGRDGLLSTYLKALSVLKTRITLTEEVSLPGVCALLARHDSSRPKKELSKATTASTTPPNTAT